MLPASARSCTSRFILGIAVWIGGIGLAVGQVVQLPSMGTSRYAGTVIVPDSGQVEIGRVRRSGSYTSRTGGVLNSQRVGVASSAQITAQVIDLDALDEAILSAHVPTDAPKAATTATSSSFPDAGRRVLPNVIARPRSERPRLPPEPGAWQLAMTEEHVTRPRIESLAEADVRYYLDQGREAEMAGHLHSARVFYRLAIEAMTPEMRERYNRLVAEKQATSNDRGKDSGAASVRF
ncbi:MAG: hypothetical protein KatS3mg111_3244 [Pirellulaceae bacterium]|nr:MAG: hypothetical protein KatS3mg111_3244 [Pirellulaceae bacterium]